MVLCEDCMHWTAEKTTDLGVCNVEPSPHAKIEGDSCWRAKAKKTHGQCFTNVTCTIHKGPKTEEVAVEVGSCGPCRHYDPIPGKYPYGTCGSNPKYYVIQKPIKCPRFEPGAAELTQVGDCDRCAYFIINRAGPDGRIQYSNATQDEQRENRWRATCMRYPNREEKSPMDSCGEFKPKSETEHITE